MNDSAGGVRPLTENRNGDSNSALSLNDRVRSLRLPPARNVAESSAKLPWFFCMVFAALSGFLGFRQYNEALSADSARATDGTAKSVASGDGAAGTAEDQRAPTSQQGRLNLVAPGYIIPMHRVQVSPKVGGEVTALHIDEGQFVKKGQLIAQLERTRYEFEFRRTQALVDQAKARYDKLKKGNREEEKSQTEASLREAEELRNQLRDEADRLKRSRTATSAEDLVRVQSRLTQADFKVRQLIQMNKMMQDGPRQEDIDEAYQAYLLACAQRDNAKYDLDNTNVVAPVSGIILAKRAEVGNTVRPEAFSNGLSASLCEMANLKELEVDVDISERDLKSVFVNQRCEIRTGAFPDDVYKGVVTRMMPEANRSKASVAARIRIEIPDDNVKLRPEMQARVTFLTEDAK